MLQSISSYSFQAMAHLDFPRRYFDSWEIPEKTINSILELMIKKEILLEINTSSISNDCTEPLPSYNIIKKYIELGGKKVVLGSDAHNCSFLGNGYDCIRKNLPLELEIGYFKNRELVGINSNTFEYKINSDGTLTLTVAMLSTDLKTDCLFAHEVTVRPLENGRFQYVGNKVTYQTEYGLPFCEPRITWNER